MAGVRNEWKAGRFREIDLKLYKIHFDKKSTETLE